MVHSRLGRDTEFVVLPPSGTEVPRVFCNVAADVPRYDSLLFEMQRLRGRVYAADGAIHAEDLTADGRHDLAVDYRSWHVLSLDAHGRIRACLRYLDESDARGFDDLWVRHAALSRCPTRGPQFRSAVETGMERARRMRLGFGEVGGWAVDEEFRWTVEPLRIILATYGLLELLGGCAGVATATSRHGSATILRRIGLSSLEADGLELAPYYDPQYQCDMEVLCFDSRYPNPKYRDWVCEMAALLKTAPVICPQPAEDLVVTVAERLLTTVGTPAVTTGVPPLAWA